MKKDKGMSLENLREEFSEKAMERKRQSQAAEKLLDEYQREHGKLQMFFDAIGEQLQPIDPLHLIYKPEVAKKHKPLIHAVPMISDAHMGAIQIASEIEGFGEYNPDLAVSRQLDYMRRVIKWVEMHRYAYTLNEITLLVLGDMISGDIHDELRITNAFPTPVQVVRAAEVLAQQITLIAPHFEKVTVQFVSEDNHGRLTKKPQAKEAGLNNLNYLVGHIAKIHTSKHTNVEFNIYPMLETIVSVMQRQFLISHGHGVKAWMGKPIYGIERKVGRESTARLQIIMEDMKRAKEVGFHRYIFGHFHEPFQSLLYICNGSVSGTDAYDHQAGRHAMPQQTAFMVGNHGEFDFVNFVL